MKKKLSVVLATLNEEKNIGLCLKSVKDIADQLIVVDEGSDDKTREIAKTLGANVYKVKHETNFHITKQKAIDHATGDWILQLDADERVSDELAPEITKILRMTNDEILEYENSQAKKYPKKKRLFNRHERAVEHQFGTIGENTGEIEAFFIPRVNYFLGKSLIHAGVYPDGVIRLIKRKKAKLPGKSVHELMEVKGQVAWLYNPLEHHDSPTLSRYLNRMNRYTDLQANEMRKNKVSVSYWNLFKYSFIIPPLKFLNLFVQHAGFKDGLRGFIWSSFSALHFPLAYFKYYQSVRSK